MSAFTDTTLIKKLADLNSSQQSIQTLSLWLIHHRKHYETIVKTWVKQIYSVSESRKLIYMYLANDVIQNSKKKGPEYGKEFGCTLPQVFKHIGENCAADKLARNLRRILDIWEERGVYDSIKLDECRRAFETARSSTSKWKLEPFNNNNAGLVSIKCNDGLGNGSKTSIADSKASIMASLAAVTGTSKRSSLSTSSFDFLRHHHRNKKKRSSTSSSSLSILHHPSKFSKLFAREKNISFTSTTFNNHDDDDGDSPYVPMGDAPEAEDLIRILDSMEHSASSDADIREMIAKIPHELCDVSQVQKLVNKEGAMVFLSQVNEAVHMINQYNGRLAAEMEQRGKLAIMLRDYCFEQKELLAQAEKRLDEYKKKLQKMLTVQREIRDHLSNLPDLSILSEDNGVLAPLPSPSDLFNTH